MTKLDAVNVVLSRNGRMPVSALDTSAASEAALAERLIDEIELRIQGEGWPYNTRTDVELTPGSDDLIALPAGTITIDSFGIDAGRHVSQNGDHLYDHDNNTDEFEGTLRVRYTTRFDWGCIPYPVRDLIAARAAVAYNDRYIGDQKKAVSLALEDSRARARAEQHSGRTGNVNILNTADARRVRGRGFNEPRTPYYSTGSE